MPGKPLYEDWMVVSTVPSNWSRSTHLLSQDIEDSDSDDSEVEITGTSSTYTYDTRYFAYRNGKRTLPKSVINAPIPIFIPPK